VCKRFSEGLEGRGKISGRVRPYNSLKRSIGGLCYEVFKQASQVVHRWTSSMEEHFVISQISQRRNGWLVFSEEDSRHPVSR
jgi:hypothetical protein